MKNKRSADRLGWKVEWIKEGGEERVTSLDISSKRIKTKKSNAKTVSVDKSEQYLERWS